MKKLFAVLFCIFVMAGYSFAEELSYEIDSVATAQAPWKVGEKIVKNELCDRSNDTVTCDREFLGVTQSGEVLVQEFYSNGKKRSDPFLVMTQEAANILMIEGLPKHINSSYVLWYEGGQKLVDRHLKEGQQLGSWTSFYENGQKRLEFHRQDGQQQGQATAWYKNGAKARQCSYANINMFDLQLFDCRWWDEKGNPIGVNDFNMFEE